MNSNAYSTVSMHIKDLAFAGGERLIAQPDLSGMSSLEAAAAASECVIYNQFGLFNSIIDSYGDMSPFRVSHGVDFTISVVSKRDGEFITIYGIDLPLVKKAWSGSISIQYAIQSLARTHLDGALLSSGMSPSLLKLLISTDKNYRIPTKKLASYIEARGSVQLPHYKAGVLLNPELVHAVKAMPDDGLKPAYRNILFYADRSSFNELPAGVEVIEVNTTIEGCISKEDCDPESAMIPLSEVSAFVAGHSPLHSWLPPGLGDGYYLGNMKTEITTNSRDGVGLNQFRGLSSYASNADMSWFGGRRDSILCCADVDLLYGLKMGRTDNDLLSTATKYLESAEVAMAIGMGDLLRESGRYVDRVKVVKNYDYDEAIKLGLIAGAEITSRIPREYWSMACSAVSYGATTPWCEFALKYPDLVDIDKTFLLTRQNVDLLSKAGHKFIGGGKVDLYCDVFDTGDSDAYRTINQLLDMTSEPVGINGIMTDIAPAQMFPEIDRVISEFKVAGIPKGVVVVEALMSKVPLKELARYAKTDSHWNSLCKVFGDKAISKARSSEIRKSPIEADTGLGR